MAVILMFLSGKKIDVVESYMYRLRKAVNLRSAKSRWHIDGFEWCRRHESLVTGERLHRELRWNVCGLAHITTWEQLQTQFRRACFPQLYFYLRVLWLRLRPGRVWHFEKVLGLGQGRQQQQQ